MTEAEWLTCEIPDSLFRFIRGRSWKGAVPSERKFRLYFSWCCYVLAEHLDERGLHALRIASDLADQPELEPNRAEALVVMEAALEETRHHRASPPYVLAAEGVVKWLCHADCALQCRGTSQVAAAALGALQPANLRRATQRLVQLRQARVIRDIFGNPFRPVPFLPEWRTSTVLALAETMYESRDFSAMPILADAL